MLQEEVAARYPSGLHSVIVRVQESVRAMTAVWADTLFINVVLSLDIKSVFLATTWAVF